MGDLNHVELRGRVSSEPVARETAGGTAVCNFGLATNRQGVAANNETREFTDFHNCIAWAHLANVAKKLHKGSPVHLTGRLSTRTWEGQDGVRRRVTEVIAATLEPLELRTPATAALDADFK